MCNYIAKYCCNELILSSEQTALLFQYLKTYSNILNVVQVKSQTVCTELQSGAIPVTLASLTSKWIFFLGYQSVALNGHKNHRFPISYCETWELIALFHWVV